MEGLVIYWRKVRRIRWIAQCLPGHRMIPLATCGLDLSWKKRTFLRLSNAEFICFIVSCRCPQRCFRLLVAAHNAPFVDYYTRLVHELPWVSMWYYSVRHRVLWRQPISSMLRPTFRHRWTLSQIWLRCVAKKIKEQQIVTRCYLLACSIRTPSLCVASEVCLLSSSMAAFRISSSRTGGQPLCGSSEKGPNLNFWN